MSFGTITLEQHGKVIEAMANYVTERDSARAEVERLLNVMDEAVRSLRVGRTEEAVEYLASEGRKQGWA